jgi:hypothetical protein
MDTAQWETEIYNAWSTVVIDCNSVTNFDKLQTANNDVEVELYNSWKNFKTDYGTNEVCVNKPIIQFEGDMCNTSNEFKTDFVKTQVFENQQSNQFEEEMFDAWKSFKSNSPKPKFYENQYNVQFEEEMFNAWSKLTIDNGKYGQPLDIWCFNSRPVVFKVQSMRKSMSDSMLCNRKYYGEMPYTFNNKDYIVT